jgi:O-antigen/teichoic acid export membrane protein
VAVAAALGAPLWSLGALMLSGPAIAGLGLWAFGLATGLAPRPNVALIDGAVLRGQLAAGLAFLVIDATLLILLRTPELIIARLHGVAAVAAYGAVARLCTLMSALFQAILLPLWPAIGEAQAGGDRAWIQRTARRSLALVLCLWAAGAMALLLLAPTFIRVWTGHPELVDRNLIAAAVLQTLGQALLAWSAVFLGGLSLQRSQVLANGVAALAFLPLAVWLDTLLGSLGVALSQAAAMLLVAVPLAARALPPWLLENAAVNNA